jgi:type II secretory pathway component PulJ
LITLAVAFGTMLLLATFVVMRHIWRQSAARPENAARLAGFRAAMARK